MQKRLFFLKQDGWFEAEITAKLLNSSNEDLFQWTYAMMDKHGYRNYLIIENPGHIAQKQIASSAIDSSQNGIIRQASSQ